MTDTANHNYDALNRNIWTSYSDTTPFLERHYDTLSNGKGRLSYHVNYTVNPATGNGGYSRLVIGAYDVLGRVTSQTQGFLDNSGVAWKDFTVSRSYDTVGHVSGQTYPSTRTVSYSYNAGGRTSGFSGTLGGSSYTYPDRTSYTAAGRLAKERFGTSTNLYHRLNYNVRQQLYAVRLGTSSSSTATVPTLRATTWAMAQELHRRARPRAAQSSGDSTTIIILILYTTCLCLSPLTSI